MVAQTCLAKEGKYLTFLLGREDYGLEILKVREIIGMMNITAVPQVPSYIKGVINLRGKVIPVVDLRLKFGMPSIDLTSESCIIIVNLKDTLIGIIIDKVNEVLDIKQENIEPVPNFGSDVHADYILGIGKVKDSVKILLNIEKVIGEDVTFVGQIVK
ncbi:MAG: purine-binding chemotaxis protein CheW [Candidatus Omnitrophica bacterium]|nr:purine-binding chemotaxis protein CheW [Candidatus Omnitrophota bacterium]